MSDFRLYNRALSTDELHQLYTYSRLPTVTTATTATQLPSTDALYGPHPTWIPPYTSLDCFNGNLLDATGAMVPVQNSVAESMTMADVKTHTPLLLAMCVIVIAIVIIGIIVTQLMACHKRTVQCHQ